MGPSFSGLLIGNLALYSGLLFSFAHGALSASHSACVSDDDFLYSVATTVDEASNGGTNATTPPHAAPDFYARILPLGASIVFGLDSSTGDGFRGPLRDALTKASWKVNMVGTKKAGSMADNDLEAHAGDTIDEVNTASAHSIKYQPNIVLIHAGTNDASRDIDIPRAGARMSRLLDRLYADIPGVTIILSSLLPARNESEPRNPTAAENGPRINDQLRDIVCSRRRDKGQKIVLADMQPRGQRLFTIDNTGGGGGDIRDDIHPNDSGYRKMAKVWLRAILIAEKNGFLTPPNKTKAVPDDAKSGANSGYLGSSSGLIWLYMVVFSYLCCDFLTGGL